MANVGTSAAGKTLIGTGITSQSTFASIGTSSGLTNHGVLLSQNLNPFVSVTPGATGTVLMSNGVNVDPSFQTGGSIFANTITGNTGGAIAPVAGNWTLVTANTTVKFAGTLGTETQDFGLTNLLLGSSATSITSAIQNAGVGNLSLASITSAAQNSSLGYGALQLLTTGASNVAVGNGAGVLLLTGSRNILLGTSAGLSYTSSESDNICISSTGATAESHVIRLGTQGSSIFQQNICYIAGIVGVTVSNPVLTTINSSTGQLGVQALTQYSLLSGGATNALNQIATTATVGQVLQSAGAAAQPAYSTATYPLTTTVSQILYSSAANTVTGLATANRAVLTTGTTGIPVLTAIATDGQMIIGSTAGAPAAGTITSTGGTITVTTGSNTLNLEVAGGGFTWTDVTGATQAMSIENGYITDRGAGVVYTLPASAVLGAEIKLMGKLGITTITPNANQQILIGSVSGTVGVTGTIVGTNVGDCITLIATTAGASTVWRASSLVGSWTIN